MNQKLSKSIDELRKNWHKVLFHGVSLMVAVWIGFSANSIQTHLSELQRTDNQKKFWDDVYVFFKEFEGVQTEFGDLFKKSNQVRDDIFSMMHKRDVAGVRVKHEDFVNMNIKMIYLAQKLKVMNYVFALKFSDSAKALGIRNFENLHNKLMSLNEDIENGARGLNSRMDLLRGFVDGKYHNDNAFHKQLEGCDTRIEKVLDAVLLYGKAQEYIVELIENNIGGRRKVHEKKTTK
jgi:hypothetical protein